MKPRVIPVLLLGGQRSAPTLRSRSHGRSNKTAFLSGSEFSNVNAADSNTYRGARFVRSLGRIYRTCCAPNPRVSPCVPTPALPASELPHKFAGDEFREKRFRGSHRNHPSPLTFVRSSKSTMSSTTIVDGSSLLKDLRVISSHQPGSEQALRFA